MNTVPILGLLAVTAGGLAAPESTIPFPMALDAAAVYQEAIGDIRRQALVLGNGDVNGLLWERGGAICIRVTKNDLWDARIDTSKDPDLLRVDIRGRTWSGGTSKPPSWHAHPYPQPRSAAVIVIGTTPPGAGFWRCVRSQGTQNDWGHRDGLGVMSVTGRGGVSAGYRFEFAKAGTAVYSALRLRLSGTPNARYYVNVVDAAGKDLARSGWRATPATEEEVTFALGADRAPKALELYVMSKDGARAENRYRGISFEGNGASHKLDLGQIATGNSARARLDLRRAMASVEHSGGVKSTVRTLADRNVFLIKSTAAISLEEVAAPQLPAARLGETDGVRWLHMTMPGDVDYRGMEYALAVVAKGSRKAVSLVTSFDTTEKVLDAAIRRARDTLEIDQATLVAKHEEAWQTFWSASGMRLEDRFFQDAWYRNLYYMRCFCRPGTTMPITLYAGLATDRTGWHGAPTLDYNIQQTFWPMFVCNQVDLMEPYVTFLESFAPRGRWLAEKTYGVEGLFFPVNIFGPEFLVAPENAQSTNARQIAYVPWSYCLGCTGWALQILWLRYRYQPDAAYLERVYPLLRDGAEFYASVLERCRNDAKGKAEIGPSYNPEHGPFGTFNNPVDIAYISFLLRAASDAAKRLQCDKPRVERWDRQRARVPEYETTPLDGKPIVANWKGATADSVRVHNVAVPTVPIFPAEEIHWFSPPHRKEMLERTLRWIRHNGNNSHIMVNVARARFSLAEAYTETRAHFSKIATPNGLYAAWPGHGYYLAESWAFAGLTAELMLQSVGDIIRVFPAWPKEQDARFARLRAQGGFLVSAEQKDGTVRHVEVTSTVGGTLRLLSPWPQAAVLRHGRRVSIVPGKQVKIIELDTQPGERLRFEDGTR